MKIKVIDVSWHRNGISGAGFYAIIFDDTEEGRMIASLFDEPGHCAVYKLDELAKENIKFGMGNSWRGDRYEDELRKEAEKWASGRLGPFSMIPPDSIIKSVKEKITRRSK